MTSSTLVKGLKIMEDFKQEVSNDLNEISEKAEAIKEKFRKFAANPENKVNDSHLLIKGDEHYTKLLNLPTKVILDGLNEDIKVWNDNLQYLLNEKEQKIKKIQDTLNKLLNEGLTFFQAFKPAPSKRLNVFESAKSMRKIEAFGQADAPVDF